MKLAKDHTEHRRLVEYFVVVSTESQNAKDIIVEDDQGTDVVKLVNKTCDFEAVVTARYPENDYKQNPLLHQSVISFCHPSDDIGVKGVFTLPKVHYFVTTGGRGKQMYGVCLTIFEPLTVTVKGVEGNRKAEVFRPKCICILSAYPYLLALREYLIQLERLSKSGKMNAPIERYITNLLSEVAAPPPGSFEVQLSISDSVIKFWSPPNNQPIAWISLPFSHLFQCLDIENIVTLWHALALERQVLVVSTQKTLLTTVCEILISLLFPMKWSHVYIPLLPKMLVSILAAPMPFLCGVDKVYLNEALSHLNDECIVVDLDCNHVSFGPSTPILPKLPREFEKVLLKKLKENTDMIFREARSLTREHDFSDRGIHLPLHVKTMADSMWSSKLCLFDEAFHLHFTDDQKQSDLLNGHESSPRNSLMQSSWDAVQEAFVMIYVKLLYSYREYLIFPSREKAENEIDSTGSLGGARFRSKEFIKAQKHGRRSFLEELLTTQMFDEFITKRLYGSGESDVVFFDQTIDTYNTKVNKFSFDTTPLNPESESNGNVPPSTVRNFIGRIRTEESKPVLNSLAVHQTLKTIVPPEPSNVFDEMQVKEQNDNCIELESSGSIQSKQTTTTSKLSPIQPIKTSFSDDDITMNVSMKESDDNILSLYKYPVFPSTLNSELFGTPRPLPSAMISEFERQRESSFEFRKRDNKAKQHDDPMKSPEETTFNVFFIALTATVGRELQLLSSDDQLIRDRAILLTTSDIDDDQPINVAKNLASTFEGMSSESTHSETPNTKFRDSPEGSKIEEAKAKASAQLDLAFEMLDIMRQRKLAISPIIYKTLINACGRCGDADRATLLLSRMHEDNIIADGIVYSCLVTAFSTENSLRKVSGKSEFPEWANNASIDMFVDWNKIRNIPKENNLSDNSYRNSHRARFQQGLKSILSKVSSRDSDDSFHDDFDLSDKNQWTDEAMSPIKFVTDSIDNHIGFGENLLELVYPDISIDTNDEKCPQCNGLLLDDVVVNGWALGDSQDYTTKCPFCTMKFVPTFTVQCSSKSFVGSQVGTPLICERLSPWVLEKELRIKLGDVDGIGDLLDKQWRKSERKNAILWWNLILAFMRYRIPFTFLLQGDFEKTLVVPLPKDILTPQKSRVRVEDETVGVE